VEKSIRTVSLTRKTNETNISLVLNIDGKGKYNISTGIGFFDHMLELFAKHGSFDLQLKAEGDVHIDFHHTVEDIGILLGEAFNKALGDKKGIVRYGFFILPMDDALIECALDFGGRTFFKYNVELHSETVGQFDTELVEEFFKAFSDNAKINLHITKKSGKNSHHILEGIFKAVAKSIKAATKVENDEIPSTKGVL
jgi:imidazoleglycerol-phosphate dehydratase